MGSSLDICYVWLARPLSTLKPPPPILSLHLFNNNGELRLTHDTTLQTMRNTDNLLTELGIHHKSESYAQIAQK